MEESSWIFGRHSVLESLRSDRARIRQVWVLEQSESTRQVVDLARKKGVRVQWVARKDLDRIALHGRHQGVAAQAGLPASEADSREPLVLGRFVDSLSTEQLKTCILVALDQIQDPHNVGAIARSAACLGARAIVLPERRSAPITPVVVQASAGAIQKIQVLHVSSLANALLDLREKGFWIYGAALDGRPLDEVRFNFPLALVIGSEGAGMRRLVQERCHEKVRIPQSPQGVASLNASCAASILLYDISRQLKAAYGDSQPLPS